MLPLVIKHSKTITICYRIGRKKCLAIRRNTLDRHSSRRNIIDVRYSNSLIAYNMFNGSISIGVTADYRYYPANLRFTQQQRATCRTLNICTFCLPLVADRHKSIGIDKGIAHC